MIAGISSFWLDAFATRAQPLALGETPTRDVLEPAGLDENLGRALDEHPPGPVGVNVVCPR
jgi:hypothetical protein